MFLMLIVHNFIDSSYNGVSDDLGTLLVYTVYTVDNACDED